MNQPAASSSTSAGGRWMALIAALLGWMFDGAEMGVFSMVGRDAVINLLPLDAAGNPPTETEVGRYFGIIIAVFLIGAAAGGVLFGWLGDKIGRVRAMSISVLVYALLTGACGFAQTPFQLGILRFLASLGMGGEWALGVALVMEVWPNRSRALMAGLIGAAANAGYLLVALVSMSLLPFLATVKELLIDIAIPADTAEMLVAHKGWRVMMMLGTLPALLTFFFRIFVPESRSWEEEKSRGHTDGWRTPDLLGVLFGCLGPGLIITVWSYPDTSLPLRLIATAIGLIIATVGFSFPVMRYIDRSVKEADHAVSLSRRSILSRMFLGAALSAVALLGTWGTTQWAPTWTGKLWAAQSAELQAAGVTPDQYDLFQRYPREWTQIATAVGAIIGTILAAWLGEKLGRRATYFFMCIFSMVSVFWLYQFHSAFDSGLLIAALVAGICSASFYGWLPLYLPELFPTRVRATGQGFAFNFGRILSTIGTLQMSSLLQNFDSFKPTPGSRWICSCL
ncbi:MAG: MFS transporter [Pirellulales bacterium]